MTIANHCGLYKRLQLWSWTDVVVGLRQGSKSEIFPKLHTFSWKNFYQLTYFPAISKLLSSIHRLSFNLWLLNYSFESFLNIQMICEDVFFKKDSFFEQECQIFSHSLGYFLECSFRPIKLRLTFLHFISCVLIGLEGNSSLIPRNKQKWRDRENMQLLEFWKTILFFWSMQRLTLVRPCRLKSTKTREDLGVRIVLLLLEKH